MGWTPRQETVLIYLKELLDVNVAIYTEAQMHDRGGLNESIEVDDLTIRKIVLEMAKRGLASNLGEEKLPPACNAEVRSIDLGILVHFAWWVWDDKKEHLQQENDHD